MDSRVHSSTILMRLHVHSVLKVLTNNKGIQCSPIPGKHPERYITAGAKFNSQWFLRWTWTQLYQLGLAVCSMMYHKIESLTIFGVGISSPHVLMCVCVN